MNQPMYQAPPPAPPAGGSGWSLKIAVLFGAVIALLAATVYLFIQVEGLKTDLTKFRESTNQDISNLRQSSTMTAATQRQRMEQLQLEQEAWQRQAKVAVGQAKTEAMSRAEALTRQIAEEQKRQQAQFASQISEVREATTEASAKIGEVKTDVGTVKTEVAATRAELEKTVAELKRVTGDMGVMSGAIATNAKELGALKQLGDRNYFEFDLKKTKAPHKIGDIAVLLKKTDQKKHKYTIDVIADDKRVEKKDKNINEPVQFYTSKARQPYELVVNNVRKDQIIGYLATPKVQEGR